MKVFTNFPNFTKIVLATNIAETSVTIPGTRYVIDCGLAKVRSFKNSTGVDTLKVEAISKASAT
jgi:ATP-dependent RNA helicase DHX33